MSSNEETWREDLLRVAEYAVTDLQSIADQWHELAGRLRGAIDEANREPKSSDKLDEVREIMISDPGLNELLRRNFPQAARPRPFEGRNEQSVR
jgi:hypothetical protein